MIILLFIINVSARGGWVVGAVSKIKYFSQAKNSRTLSIKLRKGGQTQGAGKEGGGSDCISECFGGRVQGISGAGEGAVTVDAAVDG